MSTRLYDLRVVLVDDDRPLAKLVKSMLENIGITRVEVAYDGRTAISLLDTHEDIDLVLCDWNMPDMSGLEALQMIRILYPDLPFLMMTGRRDKQSVLRAKDSGVTDFIAKPLCQNDLEKKIMRLVTQGLVA